MNLKNQIFLIIILALTGCNLTKHDKSSESVDEDTIVFHSNNSYSDSSAVATFECEDFVSEALNNYTIPILNKEYKGILNCSKESVVNRHDSDVIDTIYTFSNAENKIQIYRAEENDFIFTFEVMDSIFKLTGNIKTGMTKENFIRKFQITETINNQVQIVNSEGTMRLMFYFENNRLKLINSYLYLD
jgi:hypothetical protein